MRQRVLGIMLAVTTTGCLVNIEQTKDPSAAFDSARQEAASVQGLPGPATHVSILVYDPHDQNLVRVNVPFWLAKKMAEEDKDDDFIPARARGKVRFADLQKAGKGTVIEVEEDDGERVLVWLR
jgi:hypothetical protein